MSEDMTYEPVTDWRRRATELADTLNRRNMDVARLTARVGELESENAELRDERAEAISLMMKFQRERDELRARLDAVPTASIARMIWGDATQPGYIDAVGYIGNWLIAEEAVPL